MTQNTKQMNLTKHKELTEKATAVIDLIQYAESRIKVRDENIKRFTGVFLFSEKKHIADNEITKKAKARLEAYYRSIIGKINAVVATEKNLKAETLDELYKYGTITAEDLDTTISTLKTIKVRVSVLERQEYHTSKMYGKSINFDNVVTLRGVKSDIDNAVKITGTYGN